MTPFIFFLIAMLATAIVILSCRLQILEKKVSVIIKFLGIGQLFDDEQ